MSKILKISALAVLIFLAGSSKVVAKDGAISSQDNSGVTILQDPNASGVPDGGATALLLGTSAVAVLARARAASKRS